MITNFQPHFHLRGKAMKVEAILPDGSRQIVSYVGNFNFNWMTNYIYDDDAAPVFPKGTVIQVSAFYDNTNANKSNPDPEQWVGYGDRTVDEMAHAWMNVVYLTDAEYQALAARCRRLGLRGWRGLHHVDRGGRRGRCRHETELYAERPAGERHAVCNRSAVRTLTAAAGASRDRLPSGRLGL